MIVEELVYIVFHETNLVQ